MSLQALEKRRLDLLASKASANSLLREKSDLLMVSIAQRPDGNHDALRAEVEKLEREIVHHDREVQRIASAAASVKAKNTAAAKKLEFEQLQHSHAETKRQGRLLTALASKIVDTIERLGPLLLEYETLSKERGQVAYGVVSRTRRDGIYRDFYAVAAQRDKQEIAAVVASAVWQSGLGRTGIKLSPWLEVTPPQRAPWYGHDDLHSALECVIETLDERLDRGMNKGLTAAREELIGE